MRKRILNYATILTILAIGSACTSNQTANNASETDTLKQETKTAANSVSVADTTAKQPVEDTDVEEPVKKQNDVEKLGLAGKVKHVVYNSSQGPFLDEVGGDTYIEYFFNQDGYITKKIHQEAGENVVTTYTYDAEKRLSKVTEKSEDMGQKTECYTYETDGDKTVVKYVGMHSGDKTVDIYDCRGLLLSHQSGEELKEVYTYTEGGRLLSVSGGYNDDYYVYDKKGRLLESGYGSDNKMQHTYTYDQNGNLVKEVEDCYVTNEETMESKRVKGGNTISYKRDASGKLLEADYNYASFLNYGKVLVKYNEKQQVAEVRYSDKTYTFSYAPNGNLEKITSNEGHVNKLDPSKYTKFYIDPIKTDFYTVEYYK